MYSRISRDPDKKIHPPANYSGYAFSQKAEPPIPKIAPEQPSEPSLHAPVKPLPPENPAPTLLPVPLPRGGGLGYNDLLLLGVILLLAADGGNHELLLWLLLLFFCK